MRILNAKRSTLSASSGFTLVEMIVSFGIFSIITVIAVGSFVSLIGAAHKAQSLKTVVNNLHFALENISRNLRTGSGYHCDITSGTLSLPRDCVSTSASSIVFLARDGRRIAYKYKPTGGTYGTIERAIVKAGEEWRLADSATFVPITAPEVRVEQLRFYVAGTGNKDNQQPDNQQPRVLILMKGSLQGKSVVISRFNIETLVSQRLLDIEP